VRLGFGAFLGELRDAARRGNLEWDIITCGSRGSAFDDFRTACRTHPDCFNVLLVDSEGPVSAGPREHLHARDGWALDVSGEHCHMMVQAMEAWIIADVEALRAFYGQGFQQSAIPSTQNVERIDKEKLLGAMTVASRQTQKGPYHKIHHGAKLFGPCGPACRAIQSPPLPAPVHDRSEGHRRELAPGGAVTYQPIRGDAGSVVSRHEGFPAQPLCSLTFFASRDCMLESMRFWCLFPPCRMRDSLLQ
jgi:hypothetical protein